MLSFLTVLFLVLLWSLSFETCHSLCGLCQFVEADEAAAEAAYVKNEAQVEARALIKEAEEFRARAGAGSPRLAK